jgi:hypothetical protein
VTQTYWVLTNEALTEVFLRVRPNLELTDNQVQSLVTPVFADTAVATVPGVGLVADLGGDGQILITTRGAETELRWQPPDRAAALAETPEFLEAERRAEHLIGLVAIMIWQKGGGEITDLRGQPIDPQGLLESLD